LDTVKVFPVPVAPSKVWCFKPFLNPATNCSIALGWSPCGLYLETNSNLSFNSDSPYSLSVRFWHLKSFTCENSSKAKSGFFSDPLMFLFYHKYFN
ncbi:conserved hypothetical protein, partial [Listeria marthii FSL S4-120]